MLVIFRAMGGQVLFQDALKARLDIIQPSESDLRSFLAQHPLELSPSIKEVISLLHSQDRIVYLISGDD